MRRLEDQKPVLSIKPYVMEVALEYVDPKNTSRMCYNLECGHLDKATISKLRKLLFVNDAFWNFMQI